MLYKTRVACPFLYHNIKDGIRSFMGTGPAASAVDYRDKEIVEEAIANMTVGILHDPVSFDPVNIV